MLKEPIPPVKSLTLMHYAVHAALADARLCWRVWGALNVRHVCCIIQPLPSAQNARVATVTILIPLSHFIEELLQDIIPPNYCCCLPPGMQVALAADTIGVSRSTLASIHQARFYQCKGSEPHLLAPGDDPVR